MPTHPLHIGKYSSLFGILKAWREDFTAYKGILPFVSGLRFSIQILYIIKDIIKNSNLEATWGHIVKEDKSYAIYYSNECDIIIYKRIPQCEVDIWNGRTNDNYKAMDFKFIDKKAVVGVVSCKSTIKKSGIDDEYPDLLKTFTKNVWLFAECCGYRSFKSIKKEAKKLGYKNFWCLYNWSPKKGAKEHKESWIDFEKAMIKLTQ